MYQLAVMAGEIHVGRIANSLTAKAFHEWELYHSMEPFSAKRGDWRAALIAQTVFNMAVKSKDRKPLDEFLLKFETAVRQTKSEQTWQEKKAIGLAIAASYATPSKKAGAMDTKARAAAMADAIIKTYAPKKG